MIETFFDGLGLLLLQMGVTLILGIAGALAYTRLTPYEEITAINEGNVAAGIGFAGMVLGLAIPLAAILGSSVATIDILIWGLIAVVIQIAAYLVTTAINKSIARGIRDGNIAAGLKLAAIQVAIGIVNGGAMSG